MFDRPAGERQLAKRDDDVLTLRHTVSSGLKWLQDRMKRVESSCSPSRITFDDKQTPKKYEEIIKSRIESQNKKYDFS